MKKIKILLVVFGLFLITGCGNKVKEVGTIDSFRDITTGKELIATDNIGKYSVDYIKEAIVATGDDLEIEMIVYDSSENANKIQESHINSFMNMKSTGAIIKKDSGKNYYKYTMISNGYYLVTSRVDNTLIFTKTLLKNKDLVDSVLEEIKY